MKIIFFGTPVYVIPILEALLDAKNCELLALVTQPDKPVGRRQILTPSPVKQWAINHKIQVIDSALMIYIIKAIKDLRCDLGILAAFGKIIPQDLINLFPQGILVIHPSLLPKYRGASPIQAAIINGDKETGVTIIKMDEKVDHGPIISQFKEEILPTETTGTLRERLFKKAAEVLTTILPAYLENRIEPRQQNHPRATFTKILKKDDGKIDWQWQPEKIERFIRAMTPWPGAWTIVQKTEDRRHPPADAWSVSDWRAGKTEKRLKLLKAHFQPIPDRKLDLDLVQLEGKKPVSWEEFKRGYPNFTLA